MTNNRRPHQAPSRHVPDDKEQSKLFIKTARKIEADEAHSASDQLLGRLAKMPPEPRIGKKKV
jgi:hypothetical protein